MTMRLFEARRMYGFTPFRFSLGVQLRAVNTCSTSDSRIGVGVDS